MIGVAAIWIFFLLLIGGFALDRVLKTSIRDQFDNQLVYILDKGLVAPAEIGPAGEVHSSHPPEDQRFMQPYSGLYFQVSGAGHEPYASISLWDRRLRVSMGHYDLKPHIYDSDQFPDEPLRIAERDVTLPGSNVRWRFQVAPRTLGLQFGFVLARASAPDNRSRRHTHDPIGDSVGFLFQ